MKKRLKSILKKIYISVNRSFYSIFFDKKYLSGKYFDVQRIGWKWAWQSLLRQKLLGTNRSIPWPVGKDVHFTGSRIHFHNDDINNFFSFGIYYQSLDADIHIGRGTYIAPNVGLITSNHSVTDPDKHLPGKDIVLGEKCWIGMNSVVLPGVTLGDHTVVGAGSVVTKSFPEGWCVLAGSPAKMIRKITEEDTQQTDKETPGN